MLPLRLLERQRGRWISQIELASLAAAPDLAALGGIQQFRREPEYLHGDRPSFLAVGVEQSGGRAGCHGSELPAEIVSVLHAGIEALAAGRRMDMRSVADQEHATEAVTVRQPCVHRVSRGPRHRVDAD